MSGTEVEICKLTMLGERSTEPCKWAKELVFSPDWQIRENIIEKASLAYKLAI